MKSIKVLGLIIFLLSMGLPVFSHSDGNDNEEAVHMMKELEPGAITVSKDGRYLLSGTKKITRLEISSRKLTDIKIPHIQNNEILTDIAILPEGYDTIVINTSLLNMYITEDSGKNWDQIMTSGEIVN